MKLSRATAGADAARSSPSRCAGLALALLVLSLAACSSGGSLNIGNSQSADPGTVDFPIFYVKHTIPKNPDDLTMMRDAFPQADLWMRASASPSASERNITARLTKGAMWDIKDVDVSADGKKVAFAMRGPLVMNMVQEDPPSWRIYEYTIATDTLAPMIDPAIDTAPDTVNDVSPHYLPDGRLLFSSSRQRQSQAVLLDEGKPQFVAATDSRNEPAFNLHVIDVQRAQISQVSFNQSHDRDATVLKSGRVLFTRWDNAPGYDGMHLYTSNPDGTDLQLLYGANSHMTGTNNTVVEFSHPKEMQDGRIMVLARQYTGTDFGGNLLIIDTRNYVENTQGAAAGSGLKGPAQTRATQNPVYTIPGPSPGGRFNSAAPLWDGTGRILVSWTECRLLDKTGAIVPCTGSALADPNAKAAPPIYSVWMFDPAKDTFKPVLTPVEGVMVTDIAAAQPRALQNIILDKVAGVDVSQSLVDASVGVLDIRSVYDFDGVDSTAAGIPTLLDGRTPAAQRPARFLRIEKPVSIPDDEKVVNLNAAAFGATNYMREILGYAPIEPDGSVRIEVPANVAFQMSVLDANGRRIGPMQGTWLQLRRGEVVTCNGCHTPAAQQQVPACTSPTALCPTAKSHGRAGSFASVYPGAAGGAPFSNSSTSLIPNAGETMAQTRARYSCGTNSKNCSQVPSVNVLYTDVWSAQGATPNPPITLRYEDLPPGVPIPTTAACVSSWAENCRIVINYPKYLQSIWDLKRQIFDPAGKATVQAACSDAGCHNPTDAAGKPAVPAGQLDLRKAASSQVPQQPVSYRQLLFTHPEQQLVGGILQPVPGPPDANGNPTTIPVGPFMDALDANGTNSAKFFATFGPNGKHPSSASSGLSPAEMRLISEWLDIGAQFFNNPFDPAVPVN